MAVDDYDPEDYFKDTRMSFWDHIEELRVHLWRAIIGFVLALIAGLFIGRHAVEFIASPVEQQLNEFYDRRAKAVDEKLSPVDADGKPIAGARVEKINGKDTVVDADGKPIPGAKVDAGDERLNELNKPREVEMRFKRGQLATALGIKPPPDGEEYVDLDVQIHPLKVAGALTAAQREFGRRPTLSTLSVTEAFVVYFKVSIYVGLVLAAPWIFWQLWSFIAAGLYPNEKRLVHVYFPFSIVLFLAGVVLCQFLVIPVAIRYLLSFNEWMNLEPDLRLNEWLSFAIMMPLIFGLAFQLPMVMFALYRIGIVDVDTYKKHRRIAMFMMAVLAVILSASPDVFSMMSLTVPLWLLYEVGILMCRWSPRPQYEEDEPEAEEMIEV
jgi:sec-independent protein translocase protein TatC